MIYQRIKPHPLLREFVREYLLLHFVYQANTPPLVKAFPPLPEHGLEFFPKGQVTTVNYPSGQMKLEPRNTVFGHLVSRVNFIMPCEEYLMIRVIFHCGGLFRLLAIPLTEFTDKKEDAQMVINREIGLVNDELAHTLGYDRMIGVVEKYLLGKLGKVKSAIHPVDRIGGYIYMNPTHFSLDYLADQACLSPRQLERKFTERMGIGPKLFSRICRFHQAFLWKEAHPQHDWLTIAVKFNYTDFHHLFKDFKQFAGVSPNTLLSEYAQSPEKILDLE